MGVLTVTTMWSLSFVRTITDVTEDYLIDIHKLQDNLRKTGYGEVEIMIITQLLRDNYDGVI